MKVSWLSTAVLLAVAPPAKAVQVVAAENFYGDVAQQIGGAEVKVTSILSRPDQDPHLFEATPSVARALADANIAIYSGIDYDPWMPKLLAAAHAPDRRVIDVAALAGRKVGDNPHIWYDPRVMLVFAGALHDALAAADPAHAENYRQRLGAFQNALKPVVAKLAELRTRLDGTPVTATEPVLGYLFDAIGLQNRNLRFQIAVMNDTEPSASDIAGFERDLRTHQVRLLVTNSQASDPVAERMVRLAGGFGVPVIGATETEPPGHTYQQWMMETLEAIGKALPGAAKAHE